MKQRIGIMGGTFDPIHFGHLVTAESAREKFSLDKVIFVPSGCPPHKELGSVSPFQHRYMMVMLAVVGNPYFSVSRIEYDRGGYSYTIDTMRQFRRLFGSEVDLYFITGADAILEIFSWKEPDELLSLCKFIVATRPGYDHHRLIQATGEGRAENIFLLEIPLLSISSTDIRRRVRMGASVKYLLPDSVEYYIKQNRLYVKPL